MTFKEILNTELYSKGDFTITVYNIFLILIVVLITLIALKIVRRFFKRFINKQEAERRSYWSIYLILRYIVWVIIIVFFWSRRD